MTVHYRVGKSCDSVKVARSALSQPDRDWRRRVVGGIGDCLSLACSDRAGDARAVFELETCFFKSRSGGSFAYKLRTLLCAVANAARAPIRSALVNIFAGLRVRFAVRAWVACLKRIAVRNECVGSDGEGKRKRNVKVK